MLFSSCAKFTLFVKSACFILLLIQEGRISLAAKPYISGLGPGTYAVIFWGKALVRGTVERLDVTS